jgi:hypothetical protein
MLKKEELSHLSHREPNPSRSKNKIKRDLSPINMQFLDSKRNNENINPTKAGNLFLTR